MRASKDGGEYRDERVRALQDMQERAGYGVSGARCGEDGSMSDQRFIVRTWTAGDTDFMEDAFDTHALAAEFADGSRLHGYEVEVREQQPDLFGAVVA